MPRNIFTLEEDIRLITKMVSCVKQNRQYSRTYGNVYWECILDQLQVRVYQCNYEQEGATLECVITSPF